MFLNPGSKAVCRRCSLAGARLVRAVQCSSISPSTSISSDATKGLIGCLSEKCWVGDDRVKEKEQKSLPSSREYINIL